MYKIQNFRLTGQKYPTAYYDQSRHASVGLVIRKIVMFLLAVYNASELPGDQIWLVDYQREYGLGSQRTDEGALSLL